MARLSETLGIIGSILFAIAFALGAIDDTTAAVGVLVMSFVMMIAALLIKDNSTYTKRGITWL